MGVVLPMKAMEVPEVFLQHSKKEDNGKYNKRRIVPNVVSVRFVVVVRDETVLLNQ